MVAFATTQAGTAVIAVAPLVDDGPPIASWQSQGILVDGGRRLVGSASVLVGFDGQSPTYVGAQTDLEEVWISTDQGAVSYLALGLPAGASTKSLLFSNNWLLGSQRVVDVFATVTVDDVERLFHRVLALAPLSFVGDWAHWDKVAAPPAYTASRDYRCLFSASPGGIIRGAGVYYTYASWGSTSWSSWSRLVDLPDGATAAALSPFAWYCDAQPQSQVGLLCTATNGNVYFFTFGRSPPSWSLAATGIRGAVEVAAETNISPFVARGETGLIGGYAVIKEPYTLVNFNVPDMRAVGPFTVVNPYGRTQDGYAIVLRQSDTGLGPTSFGTRR